MIQMDIPAAYVCAQAFAYCGRRWLADEKPSWSSKALLVSTVYALGVIGSCGLFLFSGWTEWEMMYWLESVRMDTANFGRPHFALVGPLFLVALGVAAAVGFKVAHVWISRGKSRKVLISLWLGVAVSLGMVLITPSAPMLVGHYHDYHAFVREALDSGSPRQYGLLALGRWTACIPWSVPSEALTKHSLITFFDSRFFIPWLIDMLIFMGSAYAMIRYFGRGGPHGLLASSGRGA